MSCSLSMLRGEWSPTANACTLSNATSTKLNIVVSLSSDIVLLLIMLVGLLRWRLGEGGPSSMSRFLWTQCLLWLLLVAIGHVPPVVLLSLNMFWTPALITLSIAATRTYRSLADFGSRDTIISFPKISGFTVSENNQLVTAPIRFNRMEVSVHTDREQYRVSRALVEHSDSYVIMNGQPRDKPHKLIDQDDVENDMSK
ncbi:hypothetical protein BC827DRAFT_922722 [Russula dissimulans]|nr:hypothetical protein BC827DRAFT_922722 [Russula dissimulans]